MPILPICQSQSFFSPKNGIVGPIGANAGLSGAFLFPERRILEFSTCALDLFLALSQAVLLPAM